MTSVVSSKLRAVAYSALAATLAAVSVPAGATRERVELASNPASGLATVNAGYDFYFGGFHVLSSTARYDSGGADYHVSATAKTQGILDFFFEWTGETRTEGRFNGPRILPKQHVSEGRVDGELRRMAIRYDGRGEVVDVVVEPEPDLDEVTPLPEGAELGTIDPLTVIADLGRSVQEGRGCTGAYEVFDGKRRYRLLISDRGETQLEPTSYSIYSGPALACHVEWQMHGGARREKNKYSRTARDRTVFVAPPLAGAPPIPVAMTIETDYGTLMAHLTSVESAGQRKVLPTD